MLLSIHVSTKEMPYWFHLFFYVTIFVLTCYSHRVWEINTVLQWSGFHVAFLVPVLLHDVSSSASVYLHNRNTPCGVWCECKSDMCQPGLAECVVYRNLPEYCWNETTYGNVNLYSSLWCHVVLKVANSVCSYCLHLQGLNKMSLNSVLCCLPIEVNCVEFEGFGGKDVDCGLQVCDT
jgi:hypothetical protein